MELLDRLDVGKCLIGGMFAWTFEVVGRLIDWLAV